VIVVPAIDIRGGKCVRLVQGDYARETVFGDEPADMARRWMGEGATALHLVDLDGAKSGRRENEPTVRGVLRAVAENVSGGGVRPTTQLGGGIRDIGAVEFWLGAGVDRVILGTAAVSEPNLVETAAARFAGRVWVGIDARGGKVAVDGWTRTTGREAADLAGEMQELGAAGIIYTDIGRDGTGKGVNVEATAALADRLHIPVFASGGVHSREDVVKLRGVAGKGIAGVIVGRALYDGAVTLADLLSAAM
jgi:phosphoribosylformimino-5-aminoimidazole carboxamide ribotide isomerase